MSWFSRTGAPAPGAFLPDKALLIDVRSPGEYASGHVQGALNLPLERLAQEIENVAPDKTRPVMLYCLSGGRSGGACQFLRELGYRQVLNGGAVSAVALQLQRPIERL